MYKKIIVNKNLPFKQRLKNLFAYYSKRRGARIGWRKRFKKVFKFHSEYQRPVDNIAEKKHLDYWRFFTKKVKLHTLRVCANISGTANPKYVPEEIFVADIEPTINQHPEVKYITNKSFYEWLYPNAFFPKCYFHKIDSCWFNQNLSQITLDEVINITKTQIAFPVVFKPNKDTFGGSGVLFPKSPDELISLITSQNNFVVQEEIKQHSFFNKFNPQGLNTIRICLYRSVKDEFIHVINCSLRMGVGGSLDNETAGGIVCFINNQGELNGFARDKYGQNYTVHPDTKHVFKGKIPNFLDLKKTSMQLASQVHYAKLTSFDYCLDINSVWRPIEINIFGQTIRFSQYAGQPFFDRFTDEVLEYCKQNHWALSC